MRVNEGGFLVPKITPKPDPCPNPDLDHGQGEEELNDFLQNAEKDTLGVKMSKSDEGKSDKNNSKNKQQSFDKNTGPKNKKPKRDP